MLHVLLNIVLGHVPVVWSCNVALRLNLCHEKIFVYAFIHSLIATHSLYFSSGGLCLCQTLMKASR